MKAQSISMPGILLPYPKYGIGRSLLLSLPMMLLTAFMLLGSIGSSGGPLLAISAGITWLGLNTLFFLMMRTGRTDRYRAILFIVFALSMIPTFADAIISSRGSTTLTEEDVINGLTPFCHLVIPMILLPAGLTGTIIFPGSLTTGFASIGSMVVLWLGASLVMGRGFCSWGCFYGGYDEGCSRIGALRPVDRLSRKLPFIKKLRNIDRRWIFFPFAMLLFIVLVSAATLSPTYCEWFCPFKAVTESGEIVTLVNVIQTIIFYAIFIGLVLILPLLTRRRTQCGLFCPFGAFQSFTNKANIYDVRINTEACSECKRCINECPTYSLDENSLKSGSPSITCTKCGKCMDTCTRGAITYHIKGTAVGKRPQLARMLFIYPAFLFLAVFAGGTITNSIYLLLNWVF